MACHCSPLLQDCLKCFILSSSSSLIEFLMVPEALFCPLILSKDPSDSSEERFKDLG